jgi:hypothetical protein
MTRITDARLLTAAGAALLGLAGGGVSALAAGGEPPPPCTDTTTTSTTATEPGTTTPDPTICLTTTTPDPTPPTTTAPEPIVPTVPASVSPPPAATATPAPTSVSTSKPSRPTVHTTHHVVERHRLRVTAPATKRHSAATRRRRHAHKAGHRVGPHGATLYLPAALPDPTPPSARLDPVFVNHLRSVAHKAKVDWALVLGVLRANGHLGSSPAHTDTLRALAARLAAEGASDGKVARAAAASTTSVDAQEQAQALAHYYRAVGPQALVAGLNAAKPQLMRRVLTWPGIDIYPGGRVDVMSGRVNVRVLAAILYLRQTFHEVSVSCLITGHRLYARPGVISAHIYGLAADISALGGVSIAGHQQRHSVTESAVHDLLRLPILPKQVISLLALGGPSFALSNHWDHIHVGY